MPCGVQTLALRTNISRLSSLPLEGKGDREAVDEVSFCTNICSRTKALFHLRTTSPHDFERRRSGAGYAGCRAHRNGDTSSGSCRRHLPLKGKALEAAEKCGLCDMLCSAGWGHLIRLLSSPPSPQGEGFGGGLRLYGELMFVRCGGFSIHSNV